MTTNKPEPAAWLHGEVCGGDASHNTVNVVLDNPAPWSQLPIGSRVLVQPQPAEQPAPDSALVEAFDAGQRAARADAAGLADALKAMIDQAQLERVRNFSGVAVKRAAEALAAYRKQGGE